MRILHWPEVLSFLAIDVDDTVYEKCPDYNRHQRQTEIEALSEFWGVSVGEAQSKLEIHAAALEIRLQRKPSAAEAIRSIDGLSQEWLVEERCRRWHPELFLKPYPALPEKMFALTRRYDIAFASTSPRPIVERIFGAIGFDCLMDCTKILGGGDAKPKPAPDVYTKTAQVFGHPAGEGLSIGDRMDFDGFPAREAGLGAVIVSGIAEFVEVVDRLLSVGSKEYKGVRHV